MLLLAFDTSTMGNASVSLCTEHELLCEYTWLAGNNNHSIDLFAAIQRIMAERHVTLPQLDAIAVAIGPGSFNGLRVALSTAKGLAFALGKPLLGISTLELIAAGQAHWQGPVCALQEAGRSELYAACYCFVPRHGQDGLLTYRPQQLGEYQVLTGPQLNDYLRSHVQEWAAASAASERRPEDGGQRFLEHNASAVEDATPRFLFCGEIRAATRQTLLALLPQSLFLDALSSTRHASLLAQLAVQRLQDGLEDDPVSLEPLYLRRPSITRSTRKQPLFAGIVERSDGHDMIEREDGALRH
jgi:universal bacterial protein YeaZ